MKSAVGATFGFSAQEPSERTCVFAAIAASVSPASHA